MFNNDDATLAILPEQTAKLSDAAKATLTAQLSQYYSPEQVARAMGTAAPASPAAKSPTEQLLQPVKPASDSKFAPHATATGYLPPEQKIAAFQKLRGVVDDAKLQEAAKAEGIAWSEITKDAAPPAPQTMTLNEANERLAQTSGPLAPSLSASDFKFQFEPAHIAELPPDEVRAMHDIFANGFHAAGVPLSAGQALFRALMDAGKKYDGTDEATRTMAFREEGARLQRMGNVEQIKADAEYGYTKMPEDFQKVINENFLMHDADAYLAMSRAGALMRARDSRAKK